LEPGESLVMYTDGVIDAESPQGDRYGTDRLREVLRVEAPTAATTVQRLVADVERFVGSHPQVDDICVTCLRRLA